MRTLTIDLRAPEVHPPQQVRLHGPVPIDPFQFASLWGMVPNEDGVLEPNTILGSWLEGRGNLLYTNAQVAPFYLGWAFADIARESDRICREAEDAAKRDSDDEYLSYISRTDWD